MVVNIKDEKDLIMSNTYAFGDVHGEYFKLKYLIDKIYIKNEDTLVFLGDYIDRGKYTFEVIDYLIKLDEKYNCVFVKGNHEAMLIDFLAGIYEKLFFINGGSDTIKSYKEQGWDIDIKTKYHMRKMPYSHLKFFEKKLVNYYETEEYIFVHAGIAPNTLLKNMPDKYLFWDRNFIHDTSYKGKLVVFGHTPNKKILNEKYKICIDTGGCFDSMGNLTCVKLPERTFISQGCTLEDLDD